MCVTVMVSLMVEEAMQFMRDVLLLPDGAFGGVYGGWGMGETSGRACAPSTTGGLVLPVSTWETPESELADSLETSESGSRADSMPESFASGVLTCIGAKLGGILPLIFLTFRVVGMDTNCTEIIRCKSTCQYPIRFGSCSCTYCNQIGSGQRYL